MLILFTISIFLSACSSLSIKDITRDRITELAGTEPTLINWYQSERGFGDDAFDIYEIRFEESDKSLLFSVDKSSESEVSSFYSAFESELLILEENTASDDIEILEEMNTLFSELNKSEDLVYSIYKDSQKGLEELILYSDNMDYGLYMRLQI